MNEHPADEVPHGHFPGIVPVLEDGRVRLRAMTAVDLPFVGVVDLRRGEREGLPWDIGFALHPAARGRGVMSAACPARAARAAASNRVLEGAGFTPWGREEAAEAPDASVGPAIHWERLA